MAVNWKSLRAGLLWILFSPLMFMSGVMADSTSSNLEYEIQVVICGTWSVFGVISGIGTIAGASWAVRVQTVLVWIVYAAFAVFGVAIVFYGVRITVGPLWAIAAVLFLTGIVYAMRRQSGGTEMEVEERRRAALKRAHARLFAAVARALRESDPMDLIAMGAPSDEYEPDRALEAANRYRRPKNS